MRKLIFANGAAYRRLYEVAALATLRERLRGSDIWVAGSRDYRAFEDYLLPAEAGQSIGIGQDTDPAQFVKTRAAALHERLNFVMARAARGELDGVEIEDGALYIARMKLAVPDAARNLAIRLNGMLPRVRIKFCRISMMTAGSCRSSDDVSCATSLQARSRAKHCNSPTPTVMPPHYRDYPNRTS